MIQLPSLGNRRQAKSIRTSLELLGVVLMLASCGDAGGNQPGKLSPLVGRWVQVYPAEGALDTMVLSPDHTVSGATSGFDTAAYDLTYWQDDIPTYPGELCLGEGLEYGKRKSCLGYTVIGDTLRLANGLQTALLRLDGNPDARPITSWNSPNGNTPAIPPAHSPSKTDSEAIRR